MSPVHSFSWKSSHFHVKRFAWALDLKKRQTATRKLACVASVSVGFGSKERRRNGFLVFCPREKWDERQKNEGGEWVRGVKEGNACRQTPGFWKTPTRRLTPECTQRHIMLSSASINQPIKSSSFRSGSDLSRTRAEPKQTLVKICPKQRVEKSRWIRATDAGFVIMCDYPNIKFASTYFIYLQCIFG